MESNTHSRNQHYSLRTITFNPKIYESLIGRGLDSDTYNKNRRKLRQYIIQAVGDCLKLGFKDVKIRQHLGDILHVFNHRDEGLDVKVPYTIDQIINFVRREARYFSYGSKWITIFPNKIRQLASWMKSFNKVNDWAMLSAIELMNVGFGSEGNVSIFSPNILDQTAYIDRHYREQILDRLVDQDYIEYTAIPGQIHINLNKVPLVKQVFPIPESHYFPEYHHTEETKEWFNIHLLNTGRPANTTPHPVFQHIYVDKDWKHLHFRLGTVSVFQLIAAVFDEFQLNPYRKGLRKDGGFYSIHETAYSSLEKMYKKMPYPTSDIQNSAHIDQLLKFQQEVSLPASDRGIPFNTAKAKSVLFQCKMLLIGHGNYQRACFQEHPSPGEIQARINILKRFIDHAEKQPDSRLHPWWSVRGTDSNRTVLHNPDVQNLPKDLRFLLTDGQYRVELWDISEQEAFIGIMETDSIYGLNLLQNDTGIMQHIIDITGFDKTTVKGIYHPYMKGKGRRTFIKEQEFPIEVIDTVIRAIEDTIPEVYQRKMHVQTYMLDNNGVLPNTPLGRKPLQFDNEKNSTRSIAILDQSIGAEMTKGWLLRYSEIAGSLYPIAIDLHDAIGILVPYELYNNTQDREDLITAALLHSCKQLGYNICPKVKKTLIDYTKLKKPARKSVIWECIYLAIPWIDCQLTTIYLIDSMNKDPPLSVFLLTLYSFR